MPGARHRIFDKERVLWDGSFCDAEKLSGRQPGRFDRFIGIRATRCRGASPRLEPRHLLIHWNTTDAEHVYARVATTPGTRRFRPRRWITTWRSRVPIERLTALDQFLFYSMWNNWNSRVIATRPLSRWSSFVTSWVEYLARGTLAHEIISIFITAKLYVRLVHLRPNIFRISLMS